MKPATVDKIMEIVCLMVMAPGYELRKIRESELRAVLKAIGPGVARPISEWHEDLGDCLWWRFPIVEPPYVGTPLDSDWCEDDEGAPTHFTPIEVPEQPNEDTNS